MKGVVTRRFKIIKINNKYFFDLSIAKYGVDENIEIFLKVLFEGL